jgi:hypothetical protein
MRGIKQLLDPNEILNPGKILPRTGSDPDPDPGVEELGENGLFRR